MKETSFLKVGKITKTFSYNGQFILTLDNLNFNFFDVADDTLFLDIYNGDLLPVFPLEYTEKNNTSIIVKFDKPYNDYDDEFYLNKNVYIKLDKEINNNLCSDDFYYNADFFIGWTIIDNTENIKGKIINYFDSKAHSILIANFFDEEVYIPFHTDLIENIDKENKSITFNLPKGLLHVNRSSED